MVGVENRAVNHEKKQKSKWSAIWARYNKKRSQWWWWLFRWKATVSTLDASLRQNTHPSRLKRTRPSSSWRTPPTRQCRRAHLASRTFWGTRGTHPLLCTSRSCTLDDALRSRRPGLKQFTFRFFSLLSTDPQILNGDFASIGAIEFFKRLHHQIATALSHGRSRRLSDSITKNVCVLPQRGE